jgi:hypothetical protein
LLDRRFAAFSLADITPKTTCVTIADRLPDRYSTRLVNRAIC